VLAVHATPAGRLHDQEIGWTLLDEDAVRSDWDRLTASSARLLLHVLVARGETLGLPKW
jgi:hypothetical protein